MGYLSIPYIYLSIYLSIYRCKEKGRQHSFQKIRVEFINPVTATFQPHNAVFVKPYCAMHSVQFIKAVLHQQLIVQLKFIIDTIKCKCIIQFIFISTIKSQYMSRLQQSDYIHVSLLRLVKLHFTCEPQYNC